MRTAVLAAALDDYATAGQWLDEATRRTAIDSAQYNRAFLPAREHMKALWAAAGAPADASLTQMNGQLRELLAQTPDLEQNGLFWRYRAWLKYHLGLSAFRLGDEAAASNLLQLGIQDATRAYEISTDHQNVYTYLPEAAWGWYHVARGDDSYAQGQLDAALVDYEAAFDLIEPKKNSGAKGDKTLAAFRAGYTALQLGQPERAAQWYLQAVTLAEQNNLEVELEREITKLQTLLESSTDAALAASGEKILAQAQAAYDRMEQR